MDEINLMETYTLTPKQRDYIRDTLKKSTKRPLGIPQMAWLMDLVMLFDSVNDKTILVRGKKMHWVIINAAVEGDSENLYWSNKMGWVDQADASWFSDRERLDYDLPMYGEWLRIERV